LYIEVRISNIQILIRLCRKDRYMRRRAILKISGTAVAGAGLTGCVGGGGASGGYTFMMSPTDPQEQMRAQYTPVAEYLTEELGSGVSLQYASSYSAINRALGTGNGQMAEMGPIAAALGVESENVEIVLQRRGYGSWTYSSVIVTREDSDIETLEDLKGREIAFADMLSASGSVYPLDMLKDAGMEVGNAPKNDNGAEFDATWSGHAPAFESLMAGQADAAGIGLFMATGDDGDYKDGVREVARRDGLARAPIVVSPDMSDGEKETFVNSLVDAPEEIYHGESGNPENEDDNLWFNGVRPASVETYESMIETARGLGIEIDLLDQTAEESAED